MAHKGPHAPPQPQGEVTSTATEPPEQPADQSPETMRLLCDEQDVLQPGQAGGAGADGFDGCAGTPRSAAAPA